MADDQSSAPIPEEELRAALRDQLAAIQEEGDWGIIPAELNGVPVALPEPARPPEEG